MFHSAKVKSFPSLDSTRLFWYHFLIRAVGPDLQTCCLGIKTDDYLHKRGFWKQSIIILPERLSNFPGISSFFGFTLNTKGSQILFYHILSQIEYISIYTVYSI